jgi:hypothetical protein
MNRYMRSSRHPCLAIALLGALSALVFGGCKHYPARVEGKVFERDGITQSYDTSSPATVTNAIPLAGATVSVVVQNPGGGTTLLTTTSAADGTYYLELPDELPSGTVLTASAPGYESRNYWLPEKPGAHIRGFILKKSNKS